MTVDVHSASSKETCMRANYIINVLVFNARAARAARAALKTNYTKPAHSRWNVVKES